MTISGASEGAKHRSHGPRFEPRGCWSTSGGTSAPFDHEGMSFEARFALIAERMDQDLEAFPEHPCPVVQCYRRTVIGARHTDTEPGFEAVLRIGACSVTLIHGHLPVLMYRALVVIG